MRVFCAGSAAVGYVRVILIDMAAAGFLQPLSGCKEEGKKGRFMGKSKMQSFELVWLLAFNVRKLRERREWTRQELAARAGLTHMTVGRIESCTGEPMLWTVWAVADALGVSVQRLLVDVMGERDKRVSGNNAAPQ